MKLYEDDELLQLSGIQHFAFCRRQWGLIHIEQQWAENFRTTDGELMHKNAHDVGFSELRGDILTVRGIYLRSRKLGISGQCDVVEFRRSPDGVPLAGREGTWHPYPVEYKRGAPKDGNADMLQLCAQAMCLEEMLLCDIPEGALFYGETRRRQRVEFSPALREEVTSLLTQMHELYRRGSTPKVKPSKGCAACSLKELCLPALMKHQDVGKYLRAAWEDQP